MRRRREVVHHPSSEVRMGVRRYDQITASFICQSVDVSEGRSVHLAPSSFCLSVGARRRPVAQEMTADSNMRPVCPSDVSILRLCISEVNWFL